MLNPNVAALVDIAIMQRELEEECDVYDELDGLEGYIDDNEWDVPGWDEELPER